MKRPNLRKFSLWLQSFLYIAAGINHFRNPEFYYRIIPPYLPQPQFINILSGVIEIILGVLLLFPSTRKFAAYSIIAMLIAFLPAHIYLIQISACTTTSQFCWLLLIAWLRLVIGQPLLIWWAWKARILTSH